MGKLIFSMDKELHEAFREKTVKNGTTMKFILVKAIKNYLADDEPKKKLKKK